MELPLYLRMEDPTGRHLCWLMEVSTSLELTIATPGGHMDCVSLCLGQDDWLADFLSAHSEVRCVHGTTWIIPAAQLGLVTQDLLERAGAEPITRREHTRLGSILYRQARG